MSDRNQNLVSPNVWYKNSRHSKQSKNLSDRKLPGLAWCIFLSDRMSDKIKKFSRSLKMQRVTYKSCEARSAPVRFTTGPLHFISQSPSPMTKKCTSILIFKYRSTIFCLYWETKGHGPPSYQSCEALQLNIITLSVIFQLYIFSESTSIHDSVSGIRICNLLNTSYVC